MRSESSIGTHRSLASNLDRMLGDKVKGSPRCLAHGVHVDPPDSADRLGETGDETSHSWYKVTPGHTRGGCSHRTTLSHRCI